MDNFITYSFLVSSIMILFVYTFWDNSDVLNKIIRLGLLSIGGAAMADFVNRLGLLHLSMELFITITTAIAGLTLFAIHMIWTKKTILNITIKAAFFAGGVMMLVTFLGRIGVLYATA